MTTATMEPRTETTTFADNFWENADRNGIKILLERMRGAKQTCERLRHAYEARAMLEEEYGKTMLHIAHKQKASDTENGSSKKALDTMQNEFISIAESHLQLANLLRENVAAPLSALINKQKAIRKDLQASIQKLYNSRHLQVQLVRKAHKRHNMEIEKANLLVQQQATDNEKLAVYKSAEITIDKLKKVYDDALHDLEKIVGQWNVEWRKTCEGFEDLERERLAFMKSNLVNCANLMVGCVENELQSYEHINAAAASFEPDKDLTEFVKSRRSTNIPPRAMDYVKMYAYQETVFDKREAMSTVKVHSNNDIDKQIQSDVEEHLPTSAKITSSNQPLNAPQNKQDAQPTIKGTGTEYMMVGVMEVYSGDDDDDDDEGSEYTSETESENDDEVVATDEEASEMPTTDSKHQEKSSGTESNKKQDTNAEKPVAQPDDNMEKNKDHIILRSEQSITEEVDPTTTSMAEITKGSQVGKTDIVNVSKAPLENADMNGKRTQSCIDEDSKRRATEVVDPTTKLNRSDTTSIDTLQYSRSARASPENTPIDGSNVSQYRENHGAEYDNSDAAAFELDDMLRSLDSKRINRGESDSDSQRMQGPKPSSTTSSPLLQKSQRRLSSIQPLQSLHGPQRLQSKFSSRRLSSVENSRPSSRYNDYLGSIRNGENSTLNLYDPFESLSSKETGTLGTRRTSNSRRNSGLSEDDFVVKFKSPPSAQTIHDRMLRQDSTDRKRLSYQSTISSSSSSAASSVGSQREVDRKKRYSSDKFIKDFYSVGTRSIGSPNNSIAAKPSGIDEHFIDFAYALYDYEAADEGEISFKEGDLLGIVSKSEEGEQGWWEASLLDGRTRKVLSTGIVPSNFLETAAK